VGLKIHGVQQYADAIRFGHVAFKNTAEVLETTIVDDYFIAGLELFKFFHESITSNPGPNYFDDCIVDRNRLVVKRYEAVNASGEADFVVPLVVPEAGEDVTREKRPGDLGRFACELVVLLHAQLGCQSFYSPGVQVIAGTIFLFGVGMDHVPAKRIAVKT
jgi:hypothetical protein